MSTPLHVGKLVRDKIPEIIEAGGQKCEYRILSEEDLVYALEVKLDEELAEYRNDHSLEELADLVTVIVHLVTARGYSMYDFLSTVIKKNEERGSFNERIYLQCIYPKED